MSVSYILLHFCNDVLSLEIPNVLLERWRCRQLHRGILYQSSESWLSKETITSQCTERKKCWKFVSGPHTSRQGFASTVHNRSVQVSTSSLSLEYFSTVCVVTWQCYYYQTKLKSCKDLRILKVWLHVTFFYPVSFILFIFIRKTNRMGSLPILFVIHTAIFGTMLNFNGSNKGHGPK